jgi:hypothetical protein
MSAQFTFAPGADEPTRGMPISVWIAVATAMEEAGLSGSSPFSLQAIALVKGGLGLAPGSAPRCSALPTEHGLAVLMPAGSQATVEREGGRVLRLLAALDGSFESDGGPKSTPFRADFGAESLDPVAIEWLRTGERGQSSDALCRLFFGAPKHGPFLDRGHPHPQDPSDLNRCVLFLESTGSEHRLGEAAALSPEWASLVGRWAELTQLLAREAPSGSCPLCYQAMQETLEGPSKPKGPRP